jgi:hypothetical protein
MRFLIINFLIIIISLVFNFPIQAQKIDFAIENNSIAFKQINNFSSSSSSLLFSQNLINNNLSNQVNASQNEFYLISQNKKFYLRQIFDSTQLIKINDCYSVNLPKEEPLASLSFEYLLESDEDLSHFDEPVFYVVLEKDGLSQLIFAKTIEQSGFSWNRVILDLKHYDSLGANLLFYAGNLGDEEKSSSIHLKNLSSRTIVLGVDDYLLIGDQEVKNLESYIEKNFIEILDQIWPIYTFSTYLINDLVAFREDDASLTLLFSMPSNLKEEVFRNSLWKLACGDNLSQFISQKNLYLLPNLIIRDFWPNLGEKILVNVKNFVCADLSTLSLEKF